MDQPTIELHEFLLALGYHVPKIVLGTWREKQRQRVLAWALQELGPPRTGGGRRRSKPYFLDRFAVPKKPLVFVEAKSALSISHRA